MNYSGRMMAYLIKDAIKYTTTDLSEYLQNNSGHSDILIKNKYIIVYASDFDMLSLLNFIKGLVMTTNNEELFDKIDNEFDIDTLDVFFDITECDDRIIIEIL